MQEYNNAVPDIFSENKQIDQEFRQQELIARMNDKLIENEELQLKKRTFFEDSELAKNALAKAWKEAIKK